MSFKRKGGDPILYGQFLKKVMADMEKFKEVAVDAPESSEQFEEEIAE
jgi:hypothetical protein